MEELRLEKDGLILVLKRSLWSVDNRQNTERFIREVIGGGLDELERLRESSCRKEDSIKEVLGLEVRSALKGIRILKSTYNEDTYFCCGIDTYIELIEAKLLDFDEPALEPRTKK